MKENQEYVGRDGGTEEEGGQNDILGMVVGGRNTYSLLPTKHTYPFLPLVRAFTFPFPALEDLSRLHLPPANMRIGPRDFFRDRLFLTSPSPPPDDALASSSPVFPSFPTTTTFSFLLDSSSDEKGVGEEGDGALEEHTISVSSTSSFSPVFLGETQGLSDDVGATAALRFRELRRRVEVRPPPVDCDASTMLVLPILTYYW